MLNCLEPKYESRRKKIMQSWNWEEERKGCRVEIEFM